MGLIIVSAIVLLLVCVIVTAIKINEEKSKNIKSYSVKVHGQELYLDQKLYEEYRRKKVEEEKKLEAERVAAQELKQQNFSNQIKELKDKILEFANKSNDVIDKQVFKNLYKTEIKDEKDYERLCFMFNNGKLRSNDEISDYDWQIKCQNYKDNFNYERHKVNLIAFFLPFTITFTLVTAVLWKRWWFLSLLPSSLLAFLFAYFGMMIGYKVNLSNAELYGLSNSDPGVEAEKLKYKAGIFGGVIAAGKSIHDTKSAVKDITNVDGWKEFK